MKKNTAYLALFLNFTCLAFAIEPQPTPNSENPCSLFVNTWDGQNFQSCIEYLGKIDKAHLKANLSGDEASRLKADQNISFLFENREKLFYSVLDKASKGDEKAVAILIWIEPLIGHYVHPSEQLTNALGECITSNPKAYLSNFKEIMADLKGWNPVDDYGTGCMYGYPNLDKFISVIKRRISAIESVRDPDLDNVKKTVLKELNEDLKDWEKNRKADG